MIEETNIFRWATSELSQDAFICWMLSWADKDATERDPILHEAGMVFLNTLLQLHGEAAVPGQSVVVHKQLHAVDVVAEVGNGIVLLIEDKTDTTERKGQLERYLATIGSAYPDRKVLPVFFKTGDQGSYKAPNEAGYKLFRRTDLLRLLREIGVNARRNAIFADFLAHMEGRDKATRAYKSSSVDTWDDYAWQGFFLALQEQFTDMNWAYVPSFSGGFMGAWWHSDNWGTWDTYLQIEEQNLVMKMGDWNEKLDSATRGQKRDQWLDVLQRAGAGGSVKIERPGRLGNGASMTAAHVGKRDDWIKRGADGHVSLEATGAYLMEVMVVLDRARQLGAATMPAG